MRPWRSGGGRMGRQSHHGGRGELAHGWGDGGWMLGMGRARVAGVCFFFVSRRPPVYVGGGGPPSGCVRASLPFQYALVGEPPVDGAVDGVLVLAKRAAPLAGFGLPGTWSLPLSFFSVNLPLLVSMRRAVRRGRSQLAVDGRRGAANWPRGCLRAPTLYQATGTCRRLRLVLVTEFPCRLGRRSHLPWG